MSLFEGKSSKQINAACRAVRRRGQLKLEREIVRRKLHDLRVWQKNRAMQRDAGILPAPMTGTDVWMVKKIDSLKEKLPQRRPSSRKYKIRRPTQPDWFININVGFPVLCDSTFRQKASADIDERMSAVFNHKSVNCEYVSANTSVLIEVSQMSGRKKISAKSAKRRDEFQAELHQKACNAVAAVVGEEAVAATRRGETVDVGELPMSNDRLPVMCDDDGDDDPFRTKGFSNTPGVKPDDGDDNDKTTIGVNAMTTQTEYEIHPLAEIFPEIESDYFGELVKSIKEQGLLEPIVTYEGKILDGRCRLRACAAAKIEPRFIPYNGDAPVLFVWARNFARRHLTASQKFAATARFAEEMAKAAKRRQKMGKKIVVPVPKDGDLVLNSVQGLLDAPGRTVDKLSKLSGLAPDTINSGLQAIRKVPELLKPMHNGKLSIHSASEISRSPQLVKQICSGDMTPLEAEKALKAMAPKTKSKRASQNPLRGLFPTYLVIFHIHTGRNDAHRRGELVLGAFQAAYAAIGDRANAVVYGYLDNERCNNPWHVPPLRMDECLPEGGATATCSVHAAVVQWDTANPAPELRAMRPMAENAWEDLEDELKSALMPDFDELAKLD